MLPKIAIIGAGLSGLVLARLLDSDASVTVFEKSRGVGGRLATRRSGLYSFDHGAPFFYTQSAQMRDFCALHAASGVLTAWHPRVAELNAISRTLTPVLEPNAGSYWVGTPTMTALPKELARGLSVELSQRIETIVRKEQSWWCQTENGVEIGPFDWVISTAPPEQTCALFPGYYAGYTHLAAAEYSAVDAVMLGFSESPPFSYDVLSVTDSMIELIVINSSKPGRTNPSSVCLYLKDDGSASTREALGSELAKVRLRASISEGTRVTGVDLSTASHSAIHRWRYAQVLNAPIAGAEAFLDKEARLGFCGELSAPPFGVEGAYLAAVGCAKALRGSL